MTFGMIQTILIEQVWTPMFKRVIQNAIDAGLLPEQVDEEDSDGDPVYEEPEAEGETAANEAFPPPKASGAVNSQPIQQMPPKAQTPDIAPKEPQVAKKIDTILAFDVDYEPLGDEDSNTLAQALAIATDHEWVSNQTAATEMGFDFSLERKRIAAERQADRDAIAAGLKPDTLGMVNPNMPDDENEKPPQSKAA
jgi:hypothetical protein